MDPVVEAAHRVLRNAHNRMRRALEGLAPEALSWTPAEWLDGRAVARAGGGDGARAGGGEVARASGGEEETKWNSLAALTRHACGVERAFADAVAGRPVVYEAPLSNDPATAGELLALIDAAEAYVTEAFERLRAESFLEDGIKLPFWERPLSKIQTVHAMMGHTNEHKGQMLLLRKILRELGRA